MPALRGEQAVKAAGARALIADASEEARAVKGREDEFRANMEVLEHLDEILVQPVGVRGRIAGKDRVPRPVQLGVDFVGRRSDAAIGGGKEGDGRASKSAEGTEGLGRGNDTPASEAVEEVPTGRTPATDIVGMLGSGQAFSLAGGDAKGEPEGKTNQNARGPAIEE